MNASNTCLPEDASKQEQQNENQTMTFVPQASEERALKWIRWMGALPALPFSASLLVAGTGFAQGTTQRRC